MSHEIESDYIENYHNEEKQYPKCTSYSDENGKKYCKELKQDVSATTTCDFFQSVD